MSTGFPEFDAATAFARQRRRQALTRLASRVRRRDDVTFMLPFEEVVAALGRTGERHLGLQSITLDSIVGTVDRRQAESTAGSGPPRRGPDDGGRASPRPADADARCRRSTSSA